MNTSKILLPLSLAALWAAGCSENTPPPSAPEPPPPAAAAVGNPARETAAPARDAATTVVQDAADKAKEVIAAAAAGAKVQELIDAAKKLVGEGKLQDALAKLKELGGQTLSPAQQSAADALKAQIELALKAGSKNATEAAAEAVGGLLRKK